MLYTLLLGFIIMLGNKIVKIIPISFLPLYIDYAPYNNNTIGNKFGKGSDIYKKNKTNQLQKYYKILNLLNMRIIYEYLQKK